MYTIVCKNRSKCRPSFSSSLYLHFGMRTHSVAILCFLVGSGSVDHCFLLFSIFVSLFVFCEYIFSSK